MVDEWSSLEVTYIRMSSDLLNDGVIKMAGVTQEAASDIVGMLDAFKDIGRDGELRSPSKLASLGLAVEVDVLHPAVMIRGSSLGNVFLEDDDVRVWDFNGI
jgi:hypothetical protein